MDQRKHRRVQAEVTLRSAEAGGQLELDGVNLSLGGAYCRSWRALEPMTRLDVTLDLPGPARARIPVKAEAIVVRSETAPTEGNRPPYRLALWFRRMEAADRDRLRHFLGLDGH